MTRSSISNASSALLLLLAVTAGATDGTAFLRLGHVFASVITGNLVVLSLGAVRGQGHLALLSGCALGGYAFGVLVAAPRRSEQDKKAPWPPGTTVALVAELALLIAFAVVWEIDGHAPGQGAQIAMLVLCAGGMGVQSTAVRRLGQVSTTYMTSTLTGLLEAVALRRWDRGQSLSLGILLALACGAAAAAALITHARAWLPVIQLAPLTTVVLAGGRVKRG